MRPFTNLRSYALLWAAIAAGAIVYYGVVFPGQLPDHPVLRGHNDLFLHSVAFLVLSVPVLMIWSRWRGALGLVALAVAIEVVQFWLPRRNPGWDDVAASVAGVLLGAVLVTMMRRITARH